MKPELPIRVRIQRKMSLSQKAEIRGGRSPQACQQVRFIQQPLKLAAEIGCIVFLEEQAALLVADFLLHAAQPRSGSKGGKRFSRPVVGGESAWEDCSDRP
jgi:hypothetical protein